MEHKWLPFISETTFTNRNWYKKLKVPIICPLPPPSLYLHSTLESLDLLQNFSFVFVFTHILFSVNWWLAKRTQNYRDRHKCHWAWVNELFDWLVRFFCNWNLFWGQKAQIATSFCSLWHFWHFWMVWFGLWHNQLKIQINRPLPGTHASMDCFFFTDCWLANIFVCFGYFFVHRL